LEENEEEWRARPPGPVVEMKIIEGRKEEKLPVTPAYYEPPGEDLFG